MLENLYYWDIIKLISDEATKDQSHLKKKPKSQWFQWVITAERKIAQWKLARIFCKTWLLGENFMWSFAFQISSCYDLGKIGAERLGHLVRLLAAELGWNDMLETWFVLLPPTRHLPPNTNWIQTSFRI